MNTSRHGLRRARSAKRPAEQSLFRRPHSWSGASLRCDQPGAPRRGGEQQPGLSVDSGKPNSNGALECPLASMRSLGVIRGPGGHHSKPASRLPASSRAQHDRGKSWSRTEAATKTRIRLRPKQMSSERGLRPEATGVCNPLPPSKRAERSGPLRGGTGPGYRGANLKLKLMLRQPVVTKAKNNLSSCKVNAKFPHFQLNDCRAGGSHCQLMTNGFQKKQLRS
jgi:hypothetical protein